jgi:hypothetical protein
VFLPRATHSEIRVCDPLTLLTARAWFNIESRAKPTLCRKQEASFTYVQNSSKRRCQTPLGVTSAPCRTISIFISRIPVAFLGPVKAVINKVCTAVVHARGQILRARRAFCTHVPDAVHRCEYCGRVSTPFRPRLIPAQNEADRAKATSTTTTLRCTLAEILDWRKYC